MKGQRITGYRINLSAPRTAPLRLIPVRRGHFYTCFLFSSLLASGGITLGYHFNMLSPDEFGIVLVTYPCHRHLAFLFYTSTVLLPQISFEVKLAIKSHNIGKLQLFQYLGKILLKKIVCVLMLYIARSE